MNPIYLSRTLRSFVVIAVTVIGLLSVFYLSKVTYPFIIGFVIAFLMNPLVNYLELKARLPRSLAVIIGLVLIFSLLAGFITLLVVEIVSGADYFAKVVPEHIEKFVDYIEQFIAAQIIPLYNQLASMFNNLEAGQQNTIMENIQNIGGTFGTTVGNFIQNFFEKLPSIFSWIPNAATVSIFSILATFFISKDLDRLTRVAEKILPNRAKSSGKTLFTDLKKALFGFIKAQLTLISMTTVIILVGLLILRVDYAITIALISGLVDIIPYLGTGLIFVPWIIYEAIAGDLSLAIGLGVLYIIVLAQRQIMEPKVLSSNIGIDPLATLVSLFVGYKLIGFLGLIVGPVSLVIIMTLHRANVFRDLWIFIKGSEK